MRGLLLLSMLWLSACSPKVAEGPAAGIFAGSGKDRLCLAGAGETLRAGLISYAADGVSNCSASGKLERSGDKWTLVPHGEGPCRIGLSISGDRVRVADLPAACSYYCGPSASVAGKSFARDGKASPALDLAGDPLC